MLNIFHLSAFLTSGVIAMAWCPIDSSYLITCAKDSRTICWDTVSGEVWNLAFLIMGLLFFLKIVLLWFFFWVVLQYKILFAIVTLLCFWFWLRLFLNCLLVPTGILMYTGIQRYLGLYQHLHLMEKLEFITLRYIPIIFL